MIHALRPDTRSVSHAPLTLLRSALLAFIGLFAIVAQAQVNHLVISQVYGAGGNSGASYKADFIEIFNPTGVSQNLSGWSVQYASSAGSSWAVTSLSGSIAPGKYFLVGMTPGTNGADLPTTDNNGTVAMAAAAGKVALVSSTTALTGTCPLASTVDFVGYGAAANCFEGGTGPTANISTTNSASRNGAGCTDTDNTSADFTVSAVSPRNSATAANYCYPVQLTVTGINPATPTAGVGFDATVESRNAGGALQNVLQNTDVALSTNGNAGTIGGTITGTILSGTSSILISGITLSTAGTGATLTATRTAGQTLLVDGTSDPFDVGASGVLDCMGVLDGPDVPGSPCDDLDACTINDTWSLVCGCVGTFQDTDNDGTCDADDACPNDPDNDIDSDGVCGDVDNCPSMSNALQENADGDAFGDACDVCPFDALDDADADGLCADVDNCPSMANPLQEDADFDGVGDACDSCPNDPDKIAPGTCGCGNPEPGAICDDGNPATLNDVITPGCNCAGVFPSIYWDFGLVTGTDAYTTNLVANTTVSLLSRGNNNGTTTLITTTSASSGYAGASGTNNAGAAARIAALNTAANGSAYFEVTVTANPGFTVTIAGVQFGSRGTSTGPQAYTVRSSVDAYGGDLATGALANNSTWALNTSTAFSATSLPAGAVTLRIYGHNGTGSNNANTANWRIDDLNIYGTTDAVVEQSLVGFDSPVSAGLEDAGAVQVGVTMDIAPAADVTVSVDDALSGTATAPDYAYTNTNLVFQPGDTYPYTQFVTVTPTADPDVEPSETVVLALGLVSGPANLGTTAHTFTIQNDDLPALVINEIDYDQPGDDLAEFIEIKNTGASPVDLNGLKLVLMNGSNNTPYAPFITLNNVMLAAGDYYVVGSGNVPNVDQVIFNSVAPPIGSLAIQNGAPDGVRLTTASDDIIDQMSYEGDMISTEGTSADTDPSTDAGVGLARLPDGTDTDDNSVDFVLTCITPGEANTFIDSDNDGTPDCLDLCPGGLEPGTPCDDEDPQTADDVIQGDCQCAGIAVDCEGEPGGPALPGTACDDGLVNTINDTYQPDCQCVGVVIDCLGVPGGPALPGTPCNDGNPNTVFDVYTEFCGCEGQSCTIDLVVEFQSDGTSGIRWEIREQGTNTLIQWNILAPDHVVLPGPGAYTDNTCLIDGCYYLQVYDDGGDGIAGGGYILRLLGGPDIINNRDNFTSGALSQIANNEGFCLPLGNDHMIYTSCGKLDWNVGPCDGSAPSAFKSEFIVADVNTTVRDAYGVSNANTGFQFWFFDPNGGYSFRRLRSHAQGEGAPVAANIRYTHCLLNNWAAANYLLQNTLYNVRVRPVLSGSFGEFGPACRMMLDQVAAQCPVTKLMDVPGHPQLSCGQNRDWGNGNYVYARPVWRYNNNCVKVNANRYRFHFFITGEPYDVTVTSGNYIRQLNWGAGAGDPLVAGGTYEVTVEASFDNGATYCPVGDVCLLTIALPGELQGGNQNMVLDNSTGLRMYPNPNRGDQLYLALDQVEDGVNTVSVDIYDLFGKRVSTRTLAVNDGFINTVLELHEMAAGMYMVNITAGGQTYTERLVIQP